MHLTISIDSRYTEEQLYNVIATSFKLLRRVYLIIQRMSNNNFPSLVHLTYNKVPHHFCTTEETQFTFTLCYKSSVGEKKINKAIKRLQYTCRGA